MEHVGEASRISIYVSSIWMSMDATQTMTESKNKMMSSEGIQFQAVACFHGQKCEEQAIKNTRKILKDNTKSKTYYCSILALNDSVMESVLYFIR